MQTSQLRTPPRRSRTSSFAAKTERPCSKLRCGRWDLRATKSRQARGQRCTPRSLLNTPRAKRKRSPQPSVNSSTAENETPYPMSSSRPNGRQPNNMYDPYSDDDDDVMDLHMVCQLTRDIPTRQPQRNCPYTGEQYIKFLLSGNPESIREQLRMEVPTVREQDEFFDAEESNGEDEDDVEDVDEDEDEDEDEGEGEGGGEGASQVHGEVGVQNVHGNEDGVPAMQQHNHVNMSREQLVQMGQWRDEVAASRWEAYNNR